jgi:prolipoprotein diacylglyceryltransferase
MDFIFYTIYNSYFKHGNYKNDIPPLTVGGIFFISVKDYFLFGNIVTKPFSQLEAALIGWGCGFCIYFIFYFNKRYIRIYTRYKDHKLANSWSGKIIGWLSILFIMLSPFIFISIRKNFL